MIVPCPDSKNIHRLKLDPGDGRTIMQQLVVKVWSDGALSVEGPVEDAAWCIAALSNAIDAIRNRRNGRPLVVPSHDVSVVDPLHPLDSR